MENIDEIILKTSEATGYSVDKVKEYLEKIKNIFDSIKEAVQNFIELIKKFVLDNQESFEYLNKQRKHKKQISNRQRLYSKRKRLGKKL